MPSLTAPIANAYRLTALARVCDTPSDQQEKCEDAHHRTNSFYNRELSLYC
jgi:hypothetical protein